ncbi:MULTISPECIES: hypothetical protein [Rhizobium]|uniref:hypothetical protein n=1 Tax=Rhizobium TaxID=379 RepID=UPI00102FA7FC|nr:MULTISPECIES: hypothetical protein [Rhizobium]TAX51900.1 hypothetical protein ELH99_17835 [Rhizobium leguminosarum]TBB50240.1 hypothetical protein ELH46_16365 [Rhizobium ruizarguesonis]TCB17913.1 hypothetical protein E0J18_12635 [Rhizobium leguminosarum bv. viciae]
MAVNRTKPILGVLGFIAVTVGGIWVTKGHDWVLAQFRSTPIIKIDFQATGGCPGGNLIDLKRHFDNQSVALEWGADRLVICDSDGLRTNSINAAGDIAREFPGCLDYRSDSLRLMRVSAAVCAVASKNIFVCDGEAGAVSPGLAGLGSQAAPVAQCSSAILVKFGFE